MRKYRGFAVQEHREGGRVIYAVPELGLASSGWAECKRRIDLELWDRYIGAPLNTVRSGEPIKEAACT